MAIATQRNNVTEKKDEIFIPHIFAYFKVFQLYYEYKKKKKYFFNIIRLLMRLVLINNKK